MSSSIVLAVVSIACLCVNLCVGNPAEVRPIGVRRLIVDCLNTQASGGDNFTACLSSQLTQAGEVSLIPGVTVEKSDKSGGRTLSGTVLKVALPWSEATSRFFGGWSAPTLLVSTPAQNFFEASTFDVGLEIGKDDPSSEARRKRLKKLILPLLLGFKIKSALMGMLGYGVIGVLAIKAIFMSVISLIISGVLALKKLYQVPEATVQHATYEPYYHHHRSYEAPVEAAASTYSSYSPSYSQSYTGSSSSYSPSYSSYASAQTQNQNAYTVSPSSDTAYKGYKAE